ncbi:MAG: hypothetical protein ABI726_09740 [bacterium]
MRPDLAAPIRDEPLTQALREGSVEQLRVGLVGVLERQGEEVSDWRDLLMDLAPYHDCAWRLGVKPEAVFEWVARKLPADVAGTVRALGQRDQLDPAEFGFALVDDDDGPRYYWTR